MEMERLEDLAREALAGGTEHEALRVIAPAAEAGESARLWQWTGLLQRSLDEHADSLVSFERAASLDPADAGIAHGRARVALEAGVSATELFEQAHRLAPEDGDVLLGLAAAKFAEGRGEEAEADLDAALDRTPRWIQGHTQLAQLRSKLGKKVLAAASIERVLRRNPRDTQLWTALFDLAIRSSDFDALDAAVTKARRASQPESTLLLFEAIAAAEKAEVERADRLLAQIPPMLRASISVWHIRHLLRSGRVVEALPLIDRGLAGPSAQAVWSYAGVAWRLLDDPRWQWLARDNQLISITDLAPALPQFEELAPVLRKLHEGTGEYLDQSVRGGSQTDGPLFSRIDPQIRATRSAVVGAVERYVQSLPEPDPRHPLLSPRRDRPVRFSGSWSVRLRSAGLHANHVHPQGWISSAFYVVLPEKPAGGDKFAGWLTLGEPPEELGLGLDPVKRVEPREGQLVLFPSWMWHGTIPFEAGERMTVAFDVRLPN